MLQGRPTDSDNAICMQCESINDPEVFWHIFPNGWEFLVQILHVYYTFMSTSNSMSGVALAMRHRLSGLSTCGLKGQCELEKWVPCLYAQLGVRHPLPYADEVT